MLSFFYNLLILPVEYLIGTFFYLMYQFWGNVPAAIISVSILVSFLTLPLYLRADAVQAEEQKKQKEMEHWLSTIRKTFRGDERYMCINAYYRECGYRPLYALRGVLPLFLQIPFFLAAYRYLSGLPLLKGCSFGAITDLGEADNLLAIGSLHVHLLPILMTVINCISGLIYTEKGAHKQRIQIFGLAAVFLILLYPSPSGLVLYWTMNNLFSLCKNLIQKHVRNVRTLAVYTSAVCAVLLTAYLWFFKDIRGLLAGREFESLLIYLLVIAGLLLPPALMLLKKHMKLSFTVPEMHTGGIIAIQAALCMFAGAVIPLVVVSSSPADFVNLYHYVSPLHYVFTTLCVSAGFFLVWGSVVLFVSRDKAKSIYALLLFFLLLGGLFDFLLFKPAVGMITKELSFDAMPENGDPPRVLNLLFLALLLSVCVLLWKKAPQIVSRIALLLFVVFTAMSGIYAGKTINELSVIRKEQVDAEEDPCIRLSTTGQNVVVIMLDRMMGVYLPFIMEERPELRATFDGFTYYPNTVSTGLHTNVGSPGLYGGYDYCAAALNERSELSLREKQNEALMLMPRLFSDAGYRAVTWDPPYANYRMPSDLSIFREDERITALHMEGRFQLDFGQDAYKKYVERNFWFYSLLRMTPTLWQDEVYDAGNYMAVASPAANHALFDAYAVLDHLPELTLAEDDDQGLFLMMDNNTAHETMLLQLPDYTLTEHVDNTAYPESFADRTLNGMTLHFDMNYPEKNLGQYHTSVAAMMALGRWFDDLREKGVYDNTRIILVSDHGNSDKQFARMILPDGTDTQAANAFLCVKDFHASGFTTDPAFMTNCDTPALALDGIVDHPVNPYTNHPIDFSGKEGGVDIFWGGLGNIYQNNGNILEPRDSKWYHVSGDIYDPGNWSNAFYMNY